MGLKTEGLMESPQENEESYPHLPARWPPYHHHENRWEASSLESLGQRVFALKGSRHSWAWGHIYCPWDFPFKSTGVGCHYFLQKVSYLSVTNTLHMHIQGNSFIWCHLSISLVITTASADTVENLLRHHQPNLFYIIQCTKHFTLWTLQSGNLKEKVSFRLGCCWCHGLPSGHEN